MLCKRPRCFFSASLAIVFLLTSGALAQLRAGGIDSILPAKGRTGDVVTIQGHGFGARNVTVTVGGVPAQVLQATGFYVIFRVPEGVKPSLTEVVAVNPGFQSGSIEFRMLEGILLPGDPAGLAQNAISTRAPVGVGDEVVQDGLILTRLDVHLSPMATVAQVNAALELVDGGIVSMLHGLLTVTIAIPQPPNTTVLTQIASTLEAVPGISFVNLGRVPGSKQLPPSPAGDSTNWSQLIHLFPARFPAAWNASAMAVNGVNDQSPCATRKVNVLVPDEFGDHSLLTAATSQIAGEVHGLTILGGTPADGRSHGYSVSSTAFANLDGTEPTGANPFPDCLNVEGVQTSNLTFSQHIVRIATSMPPGTFLMNYSIGYTDTLPCIKQSSGCAPQDVLNEVDTSLARAYDAADWKVATFSRWNDFLVGVAGGNEKDESGTVIYPGLGVAVTDSFMSLATLPDALFASTVQDPNLWDAQLLFNGVQLPSLRPPDAGSFDAFKQYASGEGADQLGPEPNILMVGATTPGFTIADVAQETYSDSNPDVFAVGDVKLIAAQAGPIKGTSFAAPQVTGLAGYLWLLSGAAKANNPAFNDLRTLPSSMTRQAILTNAQIGQGVNLIDAYASILSVDDVQLPTPATAPVRLALLDLNNDGRFDEGDLAGFIGIYFDSDGNPREPAHPDFSRFDLNGDGFTGGSRTGRFDLDRVGSTQYGPALYSSSNVTQQIEDGTASFDETSLTDVQILCYYAYSSLYTGSTDVRKQLLAGRCGISVQPANATIKIAQQQQFTATAPHNDPVEWSVTPGCGTIDQTGLFTATTPGTCTVKATDKNDPNQVGQAGVTVQTDGNAITLTRRTCSTQVVGQSFFGVVTNDLGSGTCKAFPPAPYVAPSVLVANNVDLYTYTANYTEDLSPTEVGNGTITKGTLTAFGEVDAPLVQPGITTNPNGVNATASADLTFTIQDGGTYLLTVTGKVLTNNFFLFRGPFVDIRGSSLPDKQIFVDPSTCTPGAGDGIPPSCVQTFTVSANVTGSVEFFLFANSAFTTVGITDQQKRLGEVSLTFSFQKIQ